MVTEQTEVRHLCTSTSGGPSFADSLRAQLRSGSRRSEAQGRYADAEIIEHISSRLLWTA